MTPEDRRSRIARLAEDKTVLEKHTQDSLRLGEVKIGPPTANIVLDENSLVSHLGNTNNPGFSFKPGGSQLRVGRHAKIDQDFRHVYFKNGLESLNPMGDTKASSTTDPLPTIVPNFLSDIEFMISPEVVKSISILRGLF